MAFVPAVSAKPEKNSGDVGTQALQGSWGVNAYLGPQPETYPQTFDVTAGANQIKVDLLVTGFDSGDYGKIRLILYNQFGNPVASDTLWPLENYLNIDYTGSISPGTWKIIVSVDDLGTNEINTAGTITVYN